MRAIGSDGAGGIQAGMPQAPHAQRQAASGKSKGRKATKKPRRAMPLGFAQTLRFTKAQASK
ncbi:MAG: hypothetical protein Q4A97_04705, partial [Comamonadaceae bacterium]|nr:hypothetical protein [Comamonadaceae bacterium]